MHPAPAAVVLQVNQLLLNYTWSNITFDSVVTENLGVGDAKSAELARPLSVSSANNFWPLFYNRSEDRLLMKNVTSIFGSQVGAGQRGGVQAARVQLPLRMWHMFMAAYQWLGSIRRVNTGSNSTCPASCSTAQSPAAD